MNKIVKGIIIGFVGCLVLLILVIFVAPAIMEIQRIAEFNAATKEWRDAGYDLVHDKYGNICPKQQYRIGNESCNFDIPLEPVAGTTPSESTLGWLVENESFNEELKQNPTNENCDLAKRNILAIQETVDNFLEDDANAKIYVEMMNMYKESIQNYCQSN